MGPLFVIIFWSFILTPVGLVLGLLLSFIGIPIFHRVRRTPVEKRKTGFLRKLLVAFCFSLVFVPAMLVFGFCISYTNPDNYWEYQGAFDFWRMPLEEPYELVMIDTKDKAGISKWKENSSIISDIAKYEKRGQLVVGYCEHRTSRSEKSEWFLFDCTKGMAEDFASEQLLVEACAKKDFSPPLQMKTIRENWTSYWKDPNRRKK